MNKQTLVQSIINLAVENGVEDALRFALIEMASKRQKLPYELHYTDGYRSWFFEKNKVVDAFYYGGYLISIFDTKAVGQYNDAENRAKKVKIGGKQCMMLPADMCHKLYEDLPTINPMLRKLGGDDLKGENWIKTEGKNYCFNFTTGKLIPRRANTSELMARPVILLEG